MKLAADFREIARNSLRGKWPLAILTGFIASLMGASVISSGGGSSNSNSDSFDTLIQEFQKTEVWLEFRSILMTVLVIILVWAIICIVVSGAGRLGYATFNLKLVDNKEASVSDLFSQFHRLGAGFCMNFLIGLYTFLWSLLFIIPGIIKQYSYAMTPYILAENPDLTADEAITKSRYLMDGNKWRLFCLEISFIGWNLLCAAPALIAIAVITSNAVASENILTMLWIIPWSIPTMIGSLFLNPYMEAAYAAFYRDIAGVPYAELTQTMDENSD